MEMFHRTRLSTQLINNQSKMKLALFTFAFAATTASAQMAIGKKSITNEYVSLEFGYEQGNADMQKGITLPWTDEASSITDAEPGTLIFDAADKKVKFKKKNQNVWGDITYNDTGSLNLAGYQTLRENPNSKVIISSNQNIVIDEQPNGILVLADADKAMVLPIVDSYRSVVNPSPGTIVYDLKSKLLCTFNGTVWTFCSSTQ